MQRNLYLAAYDIREAKRLQHMRHIVQDFASGGQKSVFECWLSQTEKQQLLQRSQQVMLAEDAFLLVQISVKDTLYCLGAACPLADENFLYVE